MKPVENKIAEFIKPVSMDGNETCFNFEKLISIPTINNRNAMPISEKACIIEISDIKLRPIGPIITPAKIYAKIRGCLKNFEIKANSVANSIISPISTNNIKDYCFNLLLKFSKLFIVVTVRKCL